VSETEKLLNDIIAYLRISAAATKRAVAKNTLDTYEKALVYNKLDGKTSQAKLEADTKVPKTTIADWLAGYVQAGLASPPNQYNPSHKALFTLQELEIELGMLKKRTKGSKSILQPSPTPTSQVSTEQKTLESDKSGASN
jgi:transposase